MTPERARDIYLRESEAQNTDMEIAVRSILAAAAEAATEARFAALTEALARCGRGCGGCTDWLLMARDATPSDGG